MGTIKTKPVAEFMLLIAQQKLDPKQPRTGKLDHA